MEAQKSLRIKIEEKESLDTKSEILRKSRPDSYVSSESVVN